MIRSSLELQWMCTNSESENIKYCLSKMVTTKHIFNTKINIYVQYLKTFSNRLCDNGFDIQSTLPSRHTKNKLRKRKKICISISFACNIGFILFRLLNLSICSFRSLDVVNFKT